MSLDTKDRPEFVTKDPNDKNFLPKLHSILERLLNPLADRTQIQRDLHKLSQQSYIPRRIETAFINDQGASQLNSDNLTTYRKKLYTEGHKDPVLDTYLIAEQAFMHCSISVNDNRLKAMSQARKRKYAQALEKDWTLKKPQFFIIPLVRRMKEHGLYDLYDQFMDNEDCSLPRSIKTKVRWAAKEIDREAQKAFNSRRFTIMHTDGMAPSQIEVNAATKTQNGLGTKNNQRTSDPRIENRNTQNVRDLLLKDTDIKSAPMFEIKTIAQPTIQHATHSEDIDPRETYLYRTREATYTWFHVERTDGQWVNIGVSTDNELPVYVCLHDMAVDLDKQQVTASIDKLRANVRTQILYPSRNGGMKALLPRLQDAIHIDKDDIEPQIHNLIDWKGRAGAGFALINSIIGHIEATGEDPKTTTGIIRHGEKTIDPQTGLQVSLHEEAEWHTAAGTLNRGAMPDFESVTRWSDMCKIARHFRASNNGQAHIPVLNPKARQKVYAAPQRDLKRT